ncbi:MAG: PH domain-containing protein [Pseudonocardiaceae bacterium]
MADRAHSESDRAHSESDRAHRESGQLERAVFRVQRTVVLAALLAMVCAVPFAFGAPGLAVIYLLPIGYIVWVLRTRTVADVEGLTVRTVFTQRFLPWAALKGLAITRRSKVRAVLADGGEVTLPSVRARHLPALALVSRGRITDPTEPANDD